MNSKTNVFLSPLQTNTPSKEKPKEFLNTLNDLTRDMYTHKQEPVPVTEHRFEGDMLLNQSDRLKNRDKNKERLIKDLRDEIKSLKERLNFVIIKDEEIYKLKCENELLRKDVAEYQSSTVTDETLKTRNDALTLEVNDLQIQLETLTEENLKLKRKVIYLYKENERLQEIANPDENQELKDKLSSLLRRL